MSVARYIPCVRGWFAVLLPLLGGFLFLALIPDRFIESGVGKWIGRRVSLLEWLAGGLLIFVSVAACFEAFRRGSMADRVIACIGTLLTLWLITQFFELFSLPVRRPPNQAASGNGAITVLFHAQRPGRAVPEQHRWPE